MAHLLLSFLSTARMYLSFVVAAFVFVGCCVAPNRHEILYFWSSIRHLAVDEARMPHSITLLCLSAHLIIVFTQIARQLCVLAARCWVTWSSRSWAASLR